VALPAGPTVRQGHLARVGNGDLLAANAPALWACVLFLVGVRLNHVPQAYFGATCLLCRAPHRWAAASRDRGRRPSSLALPLGAERSRGLRKPRDFSFRPKGASQVLAEGRSLLWESGCWGRSSGLGPILGTERLEHPPYQHALLGDVETPEADA
jgi:hypothetical protein